RPETLEASVALYLEVMHSDRSPLSRARREMIATAVSRANRCFY
ncbi:MAG TPA: carboxymuconolactone decarboxylase family protein, partial [Thermoanaerobaculia bacterium]|nr:carboxymuconolactone decarboxylase family protein [Thermoanaerobaculia bacterium]